MTTHVLSFSLAVSLSLVTASAGSLLWATYSGSCTRALLILHTRLRAHTERRWTPFDIPPVTAVSMCRLCGRRHVTNRPYAHVLACCASVRRVQRYVGRGRRHRRYIQVRRTRCCDGHLLRSTSVPHIAPHKPTHPTLRRHHFSGPRLRPYVEVLRRPTPHGAMASGGCSSWVCLRWSPCTFGSQRRSTPRRFASGARLRSTGSPFS